VPQQQPQAPTCPRGKRESAHGGEIDRTRIVKKFRDDSGRAAFERLLHGPQHIAGARHFQRDQPVHAQPEAIETGAIKCAGFSARECALDPEHALRLPQDRKRNGKPRGRTGMGRMRRAQLVQGAEDKSASERIVERRNTQPQRISARRPAGDIGPRKRLPQMAERVRGWRSMSSGHGDSRE
jgi:hypothetical protein